MEGADAFIYGVLIFNFTMPSIIPLFFLFRLRHSISRKIVYLLTAVMACYVSGSALIFIIYGIEERFGVHDGSAPPSLLGFIGQNIFSLLLYSYISWLVSKFFRKLIREESATL